MSEMTCEAVRDRLPELVAGAILERERLALDRHLATCDGCGEELVVLEALRKARVRAPAGLVPAVLAALKEDAVEARPRAAVHALGGRWRLPARRLVLAAAAGGIMVLAAVVARQAGAPAAPVAPDGETAALLAAADVPTYAPWPDGDGVLAGGALLSDLSDEELELLLEELET